MDYTPYYATPRLRQYLTAVQRTSQPVFVKSLNLHNTPDFKQHDLEAQLAALSRKYAPVTLKDLDEYSASGVWTKSKPGLVLSLFEGYRNNYDIYYPLLEQYHMTGWFFMITDFPDVPAPQQRDYALHHDIDPCEDASYGFGYPGEDRIAMTWDEVREISEKHEIICHTASHLSHFETDTDEFLEYEVVESKRKLEREIGRPVDVFCTLWGYGFAQSERRAQFIRKAGYRYVWGGYGAVERIAP